ncbi:hypothetical protein M501DRAFT_652981 [Patellaria atrata CBS 101060]|uniref:Uncharacterized protein n=1 Tax=Patellaria atrata CBS 101060 TaxID=1346257 RepID=A0A9P4SFP2_9PEZI|nr:hypothetical protein M501DRAFT_652981 [Patellaria atrata CBS 101060]
MLPHSSRVGKKVIFNVLETPSIVRDRDRVGGVWKRCREICRYCPDNERHRATKLYNFNDTREICLDCGHKRCKSCTWYVLRGEDDLMRRCNPTSPRSSRADLIRERPLIDSGKEKGLLIEKFLGKDLQPRSSVLLKEIADIYKGGQVHWSLRYDTESPKNMETE